MALIATQVVSRVGVAPTFSACAGGGDTCNPGAQTWIEIKNTSGSSTTVTVATAAAAVPFTGIAFAAETFVVPITTGDMLYGPLPAQLYADPVTGLVTITYSQVTGLTIAVFSLIQP